MPARSVIDDAVTMLMSGQIDDLCLTALKSIVTSPELSQELVQSLISKGTGAGQNLHDELKATLEQFERIADHAMSVGCILIAHLYPIACGQVGVHDVCNSIELWLDAFCVPGIISHLRFLISTSNDKFIRDHFQTMVDRRC